MPILTSSRTLLHALTLSLGSSVLLLAGCAMANTATDVSPASAGTVALSGNIHGGNQQIVGAAVTLYAAGATGYGSVSTPYATTTTNTQGAFAFTKLPTNTGPTTPGTNTYGCPATGDPQMYIIAKGGNTQGGSATITNSAAAFIAAIGKCSTISSSTFVYMNEVVSVATMAALQQYFNPITESFGYANTTQSILGFANGVAGIANLASVSTGIPVTTVTPTSAVAGVTVTATPETSKLNLIANILASCVNTPTNTGNCTTLFANAVPPASAAVTSQPTLTFATATDTVQASYYMLVNSTASQDPTGKMANLFGLAAAAGAPYQPSLATQPLDWTLGITYAATGTCPNAATFFSSMEVLAIDANGNVWFNNGATAATNALGELSPVGAPAVCAFGTIPATRGLAIDTTGNVWTAGSNTTSSVYEYLVNGTTLNWPTTLAATGIAADGAGNIFYTPTSSTTPIQEYVAAATATATAPSISVGGNLTSGAYIYFEADNTGRLFATASSSATVFDLYKDASGAATNGYSSIDAGTPGLTTAVLSNGYGIAIDAGNNVFSTSTCCASTPANTMTKITPASASTVTGINSAKFLGGLVGGRSTAVDGAGNVWAGMGYAAVTAAINPAGVNIFALAEMDNTLTVGLSPNGTTPATCTSTGSNCPTQGGFQKASLGTVRSLAIDPTGNVWAASNGTAQTIVEIVGAAVPVVTPLAVGAKNSTLGTKP